MARSRKRGSPEGRRTETRSLEMWNSNSLVAWVLEVAGVSTAAIRPPPGGRAPGWDAGLAVAHRAALAPP